MKRSGQRITGWILVFFFFLLPLKFGTLGMMPEQPPMFPEDLLTLLVISWPVHTIGMAGALLLIAAVLFFPVPSLRNPGALTVLFWSLLLPLAALPGMIHASNWDYAFITVTHWWGTGAFILSAWWIFCADRFWKKAALNALAASALITGIDGWRQYIWGFDEMVELIRKQREAGITISPVMEIRILDARVFSSLGSCNTFAGFLLLVFPAVFVLVREWGKRFEPVKVSQWLFSLLALGLLVPPFFMTRSRGAWLCAFLTGGIWFLTRPRINWKYKAALCLAGVFLIATGAFMMHRSQRGLLSGSERLDYLRSAAIMCTEYPLSGSGWGEFFHRHMQLKTTKSDESARSPHNMAAAFASQAGIPAGVIVLGAVIVLLWELFRCKSDESVWKAGRWGIAAFLLHTAMEINDAIPASMICCVAGTLALMPSENGAQEEEKPFPVRDWSCRTVALLAAAAAFYTSFIWVRGEAAFEKLELALRPRNFMESAIGAEPARLLELLRQTERVRPRSPYPCEMVGDALLKSGETDLALSLYEKSLSYVSGRPAVHRRLALAACYKGDRDTARKHLAQARKLFPADPKNREKEFFEDFERSQKMAEHYLKKISL